MRRASHTLYLRALFGSLLLVGLGALGLIWIIVGPPPPASRAATGPRGMGRPAAPNGSLTIVISEFRTRGPSARAPR